MTNFKLQITNKFQIPNLKFKNLGIYLVFGICYLVFSQPVLAVDSTTSAGVRPAVSYPIAELGNCSSASACKDYCDDTTHVSDCVAYAKSKGLYAVNPITAIAKKELGCDFPAGCKQFCTLTENADKCKAFGQKYVKPIAQSINGNVSNDLLAIAKTALGCDSQLSCKALCAQPANYQKCSELGKLSSIGGPGLSSGLDKAKQLLCGPGGLPIATGSAGSSNYSQLISVCQQSGCKWLGNSCYCPPKGSPPTTTRPISSTSGIGRPYPLGPGGPISSTSAVQGVSTGPNLIQRIIGLIFGHS